MADDRPNYHLDVPGLNDEHPAGRSKPRRWVGIRFECCGRYARVYRNREGTMYSGRCPRCLRRVRLRVGADGIDARFFRAR
ncbi:MAG: hypothetical protein ACYSVY_16295 [Planctomycetota bacterium]